MPGVLNIRYEESKRSCIIVLSGHPSECLEQAHQILSLVLGTRRRWHITAVSGFLPDDAVMPSEFKMTVYGQAFDI